MSKRAGAFTLKIVGLTFLLLVVLLRLLILPRMGAGSAGFWLQVANVLLILSVASYAAGMTLGFLSLARKRRGSGFMVETANTSDEKAQP